MLMTFRRCAGTRLEQLENNLSVKKQMNPKKSKTFQIQHDRYRRVSHSARMRSVSAFGIGAFTILAILAVVTFMMGNWHAGASCCIMALVSPVITEEQLSEFKSIIHGLAHYKDTLGKLKDIVPDLQRVPDLAKVIPELHRELKALKKNQLARVGQEFGRGKYVSDECADYLASIVVMGAHAAGKLNPSDGTSCESLVAKASSILGMEQRAALTTTDVPLPALYASQVAELVWKYGQARKYGMVFPMGAATVSMPKLKTSPAFSYIALSGSVPEKSPQLAYVQFNAKKFGGVIRIPTEIDEDAMTTFGQFLARYIAREMAKIEDAAFFTATGDATYGTIIGMSKAAINAGNVQTLAAGKTKPSDMTLTDWRNVRAFVSDAALGEGAYYCNRTMDSLLIYRPEQAGQPATLDGYPIHWVSVLQGFGTVATPAATPVLFGDLTYGYLGLRRELDVQTSRDVYFTTDEIGVKALERFDINLMADAALAVIQLAAS